MLCARLALTKSTVYILRSTSQSAELEPLFQAAVYKLQAATVTIAEKIRDTLLCATRTLWCDASFYGQSSSKRCRALKL